MWHKQKPLWVLGQEDLVHPCWYGAGGCSVTGDAGLTKNLKLARLPVCKKAGTSKNYILSANSVYLDPYSFPRPLGRDKLTDILNLLFWCLGKWTRGPVCPSDLCNSEMVHVWFNSLSWIIYYKTNRNRMSINYCHRLERTLIFIFVNTNIVNKQ